MPKERPWAIAHFDELLDEMLKQIIPASDAVAIEVGRGLCESGVGSRSCSLTTARWS